MNILITGASSGLGFELAKVCAKNNNDLILVARSIDKLDALKDKLEGKYDVNVKTIKCDLTSYGERLKLIESIKEEKIDACVNNAGSGMFGEFIDLDITSQLDMIDLNVKSLVHMTYEIAGLMKENGGGVIMNLGSIASFMPGPLMANYYATKAYVFSFSQAVNAELKKYNIKVKTYCPGPTSTDFLTKANAQNIATSVSIADPKDVARSMYKELSTSREYYVFGNLYKVLAFITRLLPRSIVTKVTYKIQSVRK